MFSFERLLASFKYLYLFFKKKLFFNSKLRTSYRNSSCCASRVLVTKIDVDKRIHILTDSSRYLWPISWMPHKLATLPKWDVDVMIFVLFTLHKSCNKSPLPPTTPDLPFSFIHTTHDCASTSTIVQFICLPVFP